MSVDKRQYYLTFSDWLLPSPLGIAGNGRRPETNLHATTYHCNRICVGQSRLFP